MFIITLNVQLCNIKIQRDRYKLLFLPVYFCTTGVCTDGNKLADSCSMTKRMLKSFVSHLISLSSLDDSGKNVLQ